VLEFSVCKKKGRSQKIRAGGPKFLRVAPDRAKNGAEEGQKDPVSPFRRARWIQREKRPSSENDSIPAKREKRGGITQDGNILDPKQEQQIECRDQL